MKPSSPPLVTLLLIAASILAAFAQLWYPEIIESFAFHPDRPSFQTALTSLFLHANTMHLLANMVFLAAVGPAVETALTSWRLALTYLVGGLAGVCMHWWLAGEAQASMPLVGASGAIAACVALLTVRFIRLKVPLAPGWSVPIYGVTGTWVAIQVLGAFVQIGAVEGGMAYWSHVGGFGMGLLLSLVFRTDLAASKDRAQEMLVAMADRGPEARLAAAESALAQHPGDIGLMRERAEALAVLGEPAREAAAWLELLEIAPEEEQPKIVGHLARCGALCEIPLLRRRRLADALREASPTVSAQLLESVVSESEGSPEFPDALLSLAELQRELSPERANELIRTIFERFPMHPAADLARARGWKA